MSKLILIRGLPGSGKTTRAGDYTDSMLVSADDYFVNDAGVYVYDKRYIGDAHAWCRLVAKKGLREGKDVVVHNTFCCRWEMEPFIQMAKKFKAELVVVDLFDAGLSDEELTERNTHDVPYEVIAAMRGRYEINWEVGDTLPPWRRPKESGDANPQH